MRQLHEKCREQNRGLYITFVDLTNTFDTVNRDGLWKIMSKFENVGTDFLSRTDGGFYKPQRLRTQSKVMLDILRLRDLLFADDCALRASPRATCSGWLTCSTKPAPTLV